MIPVAILLAAVLLFFDPETAGFFPDCPWFQITGTHCPGCGSTRAAHHFLHGDFARAFGSNPLLIAALPFLLYWLLTDLDVGKLRSTRLGRWHRTGRSLPWILGITLVFWIARNLPWKPVAWMAP